MEEDLRPDFELVLRAPDPSQVEGRMRPTMRMWRLQAEEDEVIGRRIQQAIMCPLEHEDAPVPIERLVTLLVPGDKGHGHRRSRPGPWGIDDEPESLLPERVGVEPRPVSDHRRLWLRSRVHLGG